MGYWKYIPGFDKYMVSSDGEVVSLYFGKFKTLKPAHHRHGYPIVALRKSEGRQMTKTVHELVLTAFKGEKKPGQECRHLDGNATNCRVDNLKWGTAQENADDRKRHGTARGGSSPGEKSVCSILTDEAVRDIRSSSELGIRLAFKYGVTTTTISAVRTRKTWRHI